MQEHLTIPRAVGEFGPSQQPRLTPNSATSGFNQVIKSRPGELTTLPPSNVEERFFYETSKRGIDICVSLLLLAMTFPLMMIIAAIVKATSPGKVVYKHRRLGMFGEEFDCWKFRTMVCNADEVLRQNPQLLKEFDQKFKIDNDPRITRLGCFLRCTSLDELPQLIQVLQGKMSLIGPRPIIPRELDKYSIYGEKLLSVKPGLSGLWQTSGRSETTYSERVQLDMYYIDNRSLRLDIRLILKTVVTVLRKSGAC